MKKKVLDKEKEKQKQLNRKKYKKIFSILLLGFVIFGGIDLLYKIRVNPLWTMTSSSKKAQSSSIKNDHQVSYFYDDAYILKRQGEASEPYYLADSNQNKIADLSYSGMVRAFEDGFFFTRQNGKNGLYINHNDIIAPVYDSIVLYRTGYPGWDLLVQADNKFGYIANDDPYRLLIKPTSLCYRLSKLNFVFFPHLVLFGKKITGFFYVYLTGIAVMILYCLIIVFFTGRIIKNRWTKNIYYFTGSGKKVYRMLKLYRKRFHWFTFPAAVILLLSTYILLFPLTILAGLFALGSAIFFAFRFFYRFNTLYNQVVQVNELDYTIPAGDFFPPSYLFKNIKYNKNGMGIFFLVLNTNNWWEIINRDFQSYEHEKITTSFSRFIREDKGIFVMEDYDEEYYVFIKGKFPRINIKITYD